MSNQSLEKIVDQLRNSKNYRVIKKYAKPLGYNLDMYKQHHHNKKHKMLGVFLDIESTGLVYSANKLIELGMVKFEYTEDGYIFNLLEEFNSYQDPNIPIPPYITKLTGISDDMVKGQFIDEQLVSKYLQDVDLIIAHNAPFDRAFFEFNFPNIPPKSWACSIHDINWQEEDISSVKLEYIAYKYNFFFEGHRAIIDCLAGVHILAQKLIKSKIPVLKKLLDNANQLQFKIWAKHSPYHSKELLKSRNYRWGINTINNYKSWYIIVPESKVQEEIMYLCSDIYKQHNASLIDIEVLNSLNRYSILSQSIQSINEQYIGKLTWAKNYIKQNNKS